MSRELEADDLQRIGEAALDAKRARYWFTGVGAARSIGEALVRELEYRGLAVVRESDLPKPRIDS